MSKIIQVLVREKTPRVIYTFEVIFRDILNFNTVLIHDKVEEFLNSDYIKISYGLKLDNIPCLPDNSGLLYQRGVSTIKPTDFCDKELYPCFFKSISNSTILPFDFPAMAFWLISRYEEYQYFEPDKHGRFTAHQSFAYSNNFLQLPLIDLWSYELKNKLLNHFKKHKFPENSSYHFTPTFDIDYAWAYKNKGFLRQSASSLRDLLKADMKSFYNRIAVLIGKKPDPYYTFDYIDSICSDQDPIFFWLLGRFGKYDKNISPANSSFQKLIMKYSEKYSFGIHPSYASNENPEYLVQEISRLEKITGEKITKSRQHFLKLVFPDTFRSLSMAGIKEDYSMGYAETTGFRASTARGFYWYDLAAENVTTLKVHPFMLMDVTLNSYQQLSTSESLKLASEIIEITRKVGGELISIWHNNSFSENGNWSGWNAFYETFVKEAIKK